jgi:hypothetical protein
MPAYKSAIFRNIHITVVGRQWVWKDAVAGLKIDFSVSSQTNVIVILFFDNGRESALGTEISSGFVLSAFAPEWTISRVAIQELAIQC